MNRQREHAQIKEAAQTAVIEIRKAESALRYGRQMECDNAIRNTMSATLSIKAVLFP